MFITNLFPPYARGGAERVVETIADALVDSGNDVVVVTTQREGIGIEMGKYKIYRFRPWNLFWYGDIDVQPLWKRAIWRLIDLFGYASAKHVASIMFKEHPNIVMTHNLVGMGYRIPEMLKRFRALHIHTLHDVQLVVPSGQWSHHARLTILHSFYAWICRRRFGSPALVVGPSQWLQSFYTARGFFQYSKKIVLQNPIIQKDLAKSSERPATSDNLRLLYVGQLEEHKGILFLIEAIKKFQIANDKFQIILDVVGGGSLLEQVRRASVETSWVHVHGAVAHESVGEFYVRADAVVVPSLVHENQPTVILEAFAHGVPVIASSVGGIPELVDEKTGFLFGAGDADSLCAVLTRIVQEPKMLLDMRRAIVGRKLGLSPAEYVKQLLQAIGDIRK